MTSWPVLLGGLAFAIAAYSLWIVGKLLYWRWRARGRSRTLCAKCGRLYDIEGTALCWALSGIPVIDRFVARFGVLCPEHAAELRDQIVHDRALSCQQVDDARKEADRLVRHLMPRRGSDIIGFLSQCVRDSWTQEMKANATIPNELKAADEHGLRKRTLFFVLFNYQLRVAQFLGDDVKDRLSRVVLPAAESFLRLPRYGLTSEYPEYAEFFYQLFMEFYENMEEVDDTEPKRALELGKELCVLIVHGREQYEQWESLGPVERRQSPVDGAVFSTVYGMRYIELATSIAELCKGAAETWPDQTACKGA